MSDYRYGAMILVLAAAGFPLGASAQEAVEEVPTYLMEEIVISGEAQPSSSELIIDEDTIRMERASTIADILRDVPGTNVSVGTKNQAEIMIRGFSSEQVLVMVDGRPISEPFYGKIDLSTIGVGNVSRIRVVEGASSVRYGPNAMGGAVNILTGGPDDGPPVNIRYTGGPTRSNTLDFTHRGRVKSLGYRVYGGRYVTDGYPLSSEYTPTRLENGNLRNNSDSERTDLGLKLFWGGETKPPWSLGVSHSHNAKGLPTEIYSPRYWRFDKWDRTSLDIDGQPVSGPKLQVKTKFYAERFQNELLDYADNNYDPDNVYFDSTHDNRSAGLLVSSCVHSGNRITNAGVQVRWDQSNRQDNAGMDWAVDDTATNWAFVEHEYTVNPSLVVRGGISGQLYLYDEWDRRTSSIDPSLDIQWTVWNYRISAGASRVSRTPTLHQLFSSMGNPELKSEIAYKGEIGIARRFAGALDLSATAFSSRLSNLIDHDGFMMPYYNISKATLSGAEFRGAYAFFRGDVSTALSLLEAHDGDGGELNYRPAWSLDTRFSYKVLRDAEVYVSSRAVGRRYAQSFKLYVDAFHTEDIGVMLFGSRAVAVSLNVYNVFDLDYQEEYGFPMPGRTIAVGMDWQWSGRQ